MNMYVDCLKKEINVFEVWYSYWFKKKWYVYWFVEYTLVVVLYV